ncbi:MAG: NrsF family protein [Thermoanaerobaculia bacterium]
MPLAPPSRRALLLALPAFVVLAAAVLVLARARGSLGVISLAGGGVSLLEWLAGFGLLWLALREAVPGLGIGASRAVAALSGGVLLQILLGILIWQRTGAGLSGPGALAVGSQCASIEGAIGLPHLAIATWLALRALPIRPRWSGALAGAAAGLLADSLWHLACARNDLEHLLVWHFGATVAMTLLGAVSGSFWPRRPGANL